MIIEFIAICGALFAGKEVGSFIHSHVSSKQIKLMNDEELLTELGKHYSVKDNIIYLSSSANVGIPISEISSVLFKEGDKPIIFPNGVNRLLDFSVSRERPEWAGIMEYVNKHGFPNLEN